MRKEQVFFGFFVIFFISRVLYIKYNTFSSDLKSYARYAYFMVESLDNDKTVYELYRSYKEKEARKYKDERQRKSVLSRSHIEYPPFSLAWVSIPGLGIKMFHPHAGFKEFIDHYEDWYRWFMLIIDSLFFILFAFVLLKLAGSVGLSVASFGLQLTYYILCGLCLFIYYYYRLDLTVSFFTLASASCLFLWGRKKTSFFFLALAINYKLVPMILIPLWALGALPYGKCLLWYRQKNWPYLLGSYLKNTLAIVGCCALVLAPFYVIYGHSVFSFLGYHSDRPIQVESFYSLFVNILHLFGHSTKTAYTYGSINIFSSITPTLQSLTPYVMVLLFVGLLAMIFYLYLRSLSYALKDQEDQKKILSEAKRQKTKPQVVFENPNMTLAQKDPKAFMSFTILMFMTAIISFKVLSPQFILWFVLLLPLAQFSSHERKLRVCMMALLFSLLSSYIYPYAYKEHFVNRGNGPSSFGIFLLMARNGLLLSCFILLIREFFIKQEPKKN